ncbi:amino acid adenylation domain-containing protein [Streptomyces cyaneochromogenes]|uniref:Amino acid adenylation domain-containing protein n=1 Tax=Streptomyces cyaneochromogenes TaxID=2496836 RepID=A0A3Q9EN83_9ACTN|nr:non-ribosomal peptide synthetase [Streptomyces cyaneochromogenes]AZQ32135.1 amino acid adenylation domain-containing protein [Streptomyces cyaneochromogenes]AZQ40088.1 amino acid adenylation domain-containing protein [Streptomyces cyaneochromogenes]
MSKEKSVIPPGSVRRQTSADVPSLYPMSYEQEGIWLVDQIGDGPSSYVEAWAHHLRGAIDVPSVQDALDGIVRRHESLRSRLHMIDGQPLQEIVPPRPVPLARRQVTATGLREAVRTAVSGPVALEQPPLLRATLLELGKEEAVLAVAVHHAAVDGWSLQLLDEEFSELYRAAVGGTTATLPELPLPFRAYAQQQRARHTDGMAYWRKVLADAPLESTFPPDRPRPDMLSRRGAVVDFTVDREITKRLHRLCRELKASPYTVLAAAVTALLSRHSGQQNVVLGAPVSRREGPELESMIACLAEVLPLRQPVRPEEPFRELALGTKQRIRSAVAHRDIPYTRLVSEAGVPRVPSRSSLFQVVLTVDDGPPPGLSLPGVSAQRLYPHAGTAKFDVFFHLTPENGALRGRLEYATDLFSARTAEELTLRFRALLADAVTHPDQTVAQLAMLSQADHDRVVGSWAAGPEPEPDPPVAHEAFRLAAGRTPDATAVLHGEDGWSYAELDAASTALAEQLVAAGHGQSRVAILLERSLGLPLAVLAVLKAGGCCVAVDPGYPAERVALILHDSAAGTVLTTRNLQHLVTGQPAVQTLLLDEAPSTHARATSDDTFPTLPEVTGHDPAYLIYTSGSTGRPKGVVMPHRALAGLISWQQHRTSTTRGSRTAQLAPLSFDVAFQELFATWAGGGTLVLVDEDVRRDPTRLLGFVTEQSIERLFLPFVALQQLADCAAADGWRCASLREVVTAGEQLFITPAVRRFFTQSTSAVLDNQYGPSETHVVTAELLSGDPAAWPERPPIGRPVPGAKILVLDGQLRPVPPGTPGEICIGGTGLALGYHGQPAATAQKFVADPWAAAPARLYRSGDFGRFLPDGRIEFLGRRDEQVKIRGVRVELGEVEAAVKGLPGVADAVVTAGTSQAGDRRLVVHYLSASGTALLAADLRAQLGLRLPSHLIPAHYVPLSALPLTASGKVDRSRLPEPEETGTATQPRRPMSDAERRVATLWCEVLGTNEIGPDEDFFALGGDSLLAVRLLLKVREDWGIRLGLGAMFAAPTIARMATVLTNGAAETAPGTNTDAELAPDIIAQGTGKRATGPARYVFLTGATGFLGSHLLHDLLAHTKAVVYCLVRSPDEESAQQRLRTTLAHFGLWDEAFAQRLIAVPGDLSLERLGLPPTDFDALARQVDAVYHTGACVNLALSYEQLKDTNVRGTAEVLRLAVQHHTVPLHHVSTVGVYANADGRGAIRPDDPLPPDGTLSNGYAQSKWAAEVLLRQARQRGLPVSIYRPTRITGAAVGGLGPTTDYLWLLLKGCVDVGMVPNDTEEIFDLVPVDYVSRAVLELSRQDASGNFHVTSERFLRLTEAAKYLRALGYRISEVPLAKWRQAVEGEPTNAAYPLLTLLPADVGSSGGDTPCVFDAHATRNALADRGIHCPIVDEELFAGYVRAYVRSGFLPPPGQIQGG